MTTSSPSTTLAAPTASQLVFALTNVYSQFSFKLSTDGSKYKLWHRIFLDMCKGAKVHSHITGKSKPTGDDDEDWEAIDSRIKSWFYSTFDANLLQIISSDNCTAKDLWDKLEEFFLNNKMSRMLQLQEQFRNTKKGTLSITDICHNLKNLADALADCDSKITDVKLVMQILRQLPPSYHSIVDVITNTKPFPSFLEAKNMLLLHESREESVEPHTDTPLTSSAALYSSSQSTLNGKSKNKFNNGRNNGRSASRGGNTNVSASSHSFAGNQGHSQAYFGNSPGHVPSVQPRLLGAPPVPSFGTGPPQSSPTMLSAPPQLPAHPFHQPLVNSHQYHYGIPQSPTPMSVPTQHAQPFMPVPPPTQPPLGGHPPPQPSFGGHATQYSQPQYTDLSSVFQAMSVQPPQDNNFYMDTSASRHMTFNQGSLPFSQWPLKLKNVLVSDELNKNLISVKRFTIDNSVSVEFDPFGFTVKDLKTGSFLQRCDMIIMSFIPFFLPLLGLQLLRPTLLSPLTSGIVVLVIRVPLIPGVRVSSELSSGVSDFGPFWEHVLSYWRASLDSPDKILFLKYEELKKQPEVELRKLAAFMGRPFTVEEEEKGIVEEVVKMCSFENLSNLEVNKTGITDLRAIKMENRLFFRKGEIGDWKNYLSEEMKDRIDKIMDEKLKGPGLVLGAKV
ncbi:hypothetical protein OSB04_005392 [Centaurea solstitialis]|uniref:Sulfotransferase domain-containing protein n=1 Tax=Centaurea solstitialis TaxID=347529 RepID=A0AA38TZ19_9ASTR|nr:hypothetical protein OSB04_005392 [Centaurea solstitialis]